MRTVLLLLIIIPFYKLSAQSGLLDKRFGNVGRVTTDFNNGDNDANDVIIQPDNKIVVAGTARLGFYNGFGLVRYLPDGALDSSFGSNGKVFTNINNRIFVKANCITLQPDGKIRVGGYTSAQSGNDFTLIRYNSNGNVDSTFGINGIVIIVLGSGEGFQSLRVLPNGKILAAGYANAVSPNPDFVLFRFRNNGKIDSTFGTNGYAVIDYGYDYLYSMGLQKDGRIVLGGNVHDYRNSMDYFMISRFLPEGKLDSSFGNNGLVIENFHRVGSIYSKTMLIQPDGKIVMGGYSSTRENPYTFSLLARFLPNGKADKNFGDKGVAQINKRSFEIGNSLGLQPNGEIIFGGYVGQGPNGYQNFALTCYNSNGQLDSTFGEKGFTTTDFNDQQDFTTSLAIQNDGKIVLAGYTYVPLAIGGSIEGKNIAIARYKFDNSIKFTKQEFSENLKIYPNPVKSILQIEDLPSVSGNLISIIDFNGLKRLTTRVNSTTGSIDLSKLEKGNYLLKVESGNKIIIRKFIKE